MLDDFLRVIEEDQLVDFLDGLFNFLLIYFRLVEILVSQFGRGCVFFIWLLKEAV